MTAHSEVARRTGAIATKGEASEEVVTLDRRTVWRNAVFSWIIFNIARCIYRTLHLHHDYMPRYETSGKGCIYVTWHGRSMIAANYLRNRAYWALVSLSQDGELQTKIFERFGFQIVRGSTGRGGVRGALQMARKVKEGGALAFTPDGPRGPSHKVQMGVILMAQKSGAPIVPVGISASRRVMFTKSWDSYMIPMPFAQAFWISGDPIYVPGDLDDSGRAAYAEVVEIAINRLERKAEALAGYPNYPEAWRTELPESC